MLQEVIGPLVSVFVHVKVAGEPFGTFIGLAVKVMPGGWIGLGGGGGGGVTGGGVTTGGGGGRAGGGGATGGGGGVVLEQKGPSAL